MFFVRADYAIFAMLLSSVIEFKELILSHF